MKLPELHDRLFELLCTIDDICTEHHVRYSLAYGTAIGAVREKDFIPWDDDMDRDRRKFCVIDIFRQYEKV